MRPYSVEIFDKNMDFQFNALIEKLDFKTDAVSQVKNTFKITKNFKPSSDPRGWYVKITRYNGTQEFSYNDNYEGVITAFEEGEDFNTVTFTDLATLFDLDIPMLSVSLQGKTIESFIEEVITNTFKNSSDASQNLPIPLSTNVTSSTYGSFDCFNTDEEVVSVNILRDIINPAYSSYGIYTRVTISYQYKMIELWIGIPNYTIKTIESDLPNVIDSQFTIKKEQNTQVNKVIIYDKHTMTERYYYLYTDGTVSTSSAISGKTRVTPVHTKVLITDKYSMAKNIVDSKYEGYLDTLSDLAINSRTLTNAEFAELQNVCNVLMPMYRLYVGLPSYSFNKIYDNSEPGYGTLFNFTCDAGYPSIRSTTNSIVKECSDEGSRFTHFGDNNKSIVWGYEYDTQYNFYGHSMFNVIIEVEGSYTRGSQFVEISVSQYDHIPFGRDEGSKAVSGYKMTAAYIAEIESALDSAAILNQMQSWAESEFAKNSYNNYIEITVLQSDSMIDPQRMNIGQIVNITHDGVSYNSILTGKEVSGGLVKLIFGTIRLELTKILNMKGV